MLRVFDLFRAGRWPDMFGELCPLKLTANRGAVPEAPVINELPVPHDEHRRTGYRQRTAGWLHAPERTGVGAGHGPVSNHAVIFRRLIVHGVMQVGEPRPAGFHRPE